MYGHYHNDKKHLKLSASHYAKNHFHLFANFYDSTAPSYCKGVKTSNNKAPLGDNVL